MNNYLESDTIQASELVKLSKTWMDAMMQHDSSKLETMMAAEYNLKKGDGTVVMERAGWLNNLFHNLKIARFEQSGISALVFGNVGIVTSMTGNTSYTLPQPMIWEFYFKDFFTLSKDQADT